MSLWSKKKDTQIETPSMETLTAEEIQVIKATWKNPNEDPLLSGETILYELFHNYPENQKKFDDFKEKSLLELKGTTLLKYYGSKIINTFACAIDSMNDKIGMKGVVEVFQKIGKSHSKMKISKQSFNELREVLMEFLQDMNNNEEEKWFWTDESEKAWNKFLNFVYHVIFNVMDRKPIDYSHSVEASE